MYTRLYLQEYNICAADTKYTRKVYYSENFKFTINYNIIYVHIYIYTRRKSNYTLSSAKHTHTRHVCRL